MKFRLFCAALVVAMLVPAMPVEACGGLFARIGARRAERRAARMGYACAQAPRAACAEYAPYRK